MSSGTPAKSASIAASPRSRAPVRSSRDTWHPADSVPRGIQRNVARGMQETAWLHEHWMPAGLSVVCDVTSSVSATTSHCRSRCRCCGLGTIGSNRTCTQPAPAPARPRCRTRLTCVQRLQGLQRLQPRTFGLVRSAQRTAVLRRPAADRIGCAGRVREQPQLDGAPCVHARMLLPCVPKHRRAVPHRQPATLQLSRAGWLQCAPSAVRLRSRCRSERRPRRTVVGRGGGTHAQPQLCARGGGGDWYARRIM